ncbi:MAG: nucleotidyltransferase family protein [Lachnospiraceae bacterium]|nr:nucleotidyltransferase family protein [Lachnospiraceae bacterium]
MHITGVVAEFDPFHLGHRRLLRRAADRREDEYCVVVMSGAFTQRGDCAAFDVGSRTEAALRCGADVVLELPVRISCSGAEDFTRGSVSLLDSLGCVDRICFGSESGSIEELTDAVRVLSDIREEDVNKDLPHRKITYVRALGRYLDSMGEAGITHTIREPNNVLGIGYLKALRELDSDIEPVTVKRNRHGGRFASSSQIRKAFSAGDRDFVGGNIPREMMRLVPDMLFSRGLVNNEDFSFLLYREILCHTADELSEVYECTPDMARRIKKLCIPEMRYSEFLRQVKSRDLTESRVRRVLAHILLGITGGPEKPIYTRLLGMRRDASDVVSKIRKNSAIPVIARNSDVKEEGDEVRRAFRETLQSRRLWEEAWYLRYGVAAPGSDKVIVVD